MLSFKFKEMDKLKDNFIFNFFNKTIVKQIILCIIFTALLFMIVFDAITPEKVSVDVGDVAPRDIRAVRDIINEQATEDLRQTAMESVEPRYSRDPSVQVKMKYDIKNFFQLLTYIKENSEGNINKQVFDLEKNSDLTLIKEQYQIALSLDSENLTMLETSIYDIVNEIMSTGVKFDEIESAKEDVKKIFDSLSNLSEKDKELGASIINNVLKPNKFLDVEVTQSKMQEEANKVKSVIIRENELIARKGDVIDSITLDIIKQSGILKEEGSIDYKTIFGSLLFVLILEAMVFAYLYYFNREILENSKVVILSIIILSIIIISQTTNAIDGYLIPISAATMLISIIIDPKLAILINFFLVIIIGVITGNNMDTLIVLLIGGSVGVFGIVNTHQRYNIFLTGLIVSCANMLTILSFGLIGNAEINYILTKGLYGALNGIFSAILTVGSLPLWENIFGIITPLKLLELSNPNQPLLKRLLLEAPGTYHHSIIVGNLSEAASDAIQANSLVARVGAYYHDVGKLKRPYFFKENQINIENPHDKINPNLSTLIITNHVKDGVQLAKKNRLPLIIRDIIKQHHGETIVAYFYHKALNDEKTDFIKEEDYRYEGPKPQFKEAAIIMLADSVEAAVRSIQEPTKGKIDGLVRKLIKDKLNDGQLDECDLTLKDLDTIAYSFVNVLMGIFHERIKYPELDLNELKGVE